MAFDCTIAGTISFSNDPLFFREKCSYAYPKPTAGKAYKNLIIQDPYELKKRDLSADEILEKAAPSMRKLPEHLRLTSAMRDILDARAQFLVSDQGSYKNFLSSQSSVIMVRLAGLSRLCSAGPAWSLYPYLEAINHFESHIEGRGIDMSRWASFKKEENQTMLHRTACSPKTLNKRPTLVQKYIHTLQKELCLLSDGDLLRWHDPFFGPVLPPFKDESIPFDLWKAFLEKVDKTSGAECALYIELCRRFRLEPKVQSIDLLSEGRILVKSKRGFFDIVTPPLGVYTANLVRECVEMCLINNSSERISRAIKRNAYILGPDKYLTLQSLPYVNILDENGTVKAF